MHLMNALFTVIIVIVCITVRCNLAEDTLLSSVVNQRVAETTRIVAAGTTIFQSASTEQLTQLVVDLPKCYKKKRGTVQKRIGPLLTALGNIFGRKLSSIENSEQLQSQSAQTREPCSASQVKILNDNFRKFLAELTVTQLITVRKVAEKTAKSNYFLKQAYLLVLLPVINTCGNS